MSEVLILGPEGAGKSVLLRRLAGSLMSHLGRLQSVTNFVDVVKDSPDSSAEGVTPTVKRVLL